MSRNTQHSLQPRTDSHGQSRRLSILACKRAIRSVLEKQLRREFEQLVEEEGTEAAIEKIAGGSTYRYWSSANRASQDRMWALLAEQIDADYKRIRQEASRLTQCKVGSLQLSDGDVAPRYLHQFMIHGQPGGYLLDRGEGDLAAGVLYEAGGNIYAMGQGIGKSDSKGERLISHIREIDKEFVPRKILEMGCSAGAQSCDYPLAFPGAEVHAIDISPGMLRFAHARATALNAAVHFRQADAAETPFADESFDLIVSHNMFHEVAAHHMPRIMKECHRLLAPGAYCIHQDVPIQEKHLDAMGQFLSRWQKDNNDEPFWMDFSEADLPALMAEAGFSRSDIHSDYLQAKDGPIPWYVVWAKK